MALPLDDITIIEIDNWMAAPSAVAILADMGATVIKIEPLGGDPMRSNGRPPKVDGLRDYDFQFDVDNRGKRSICLDLTNPVAIDIIHRLCAKSQVFVCNLLGARQEKFRLDPQTLLAINPALVHATLTGYGTTGPDAWRPGYDVTAFFGRSGLYDAMREGPEGTVPMARPAQGDHTTGLALVGAILGALRLAERTGTGQVVETSLYETAVWTQASDFQLRPWTWPRSASGPGKTCCCRRPIVTPVVTTNGWSSTCPRHQAGANSARPLARPNGWRTNVLKMRAVAFR